MFERLLLESRERGPPVGTVGQGGRARDVFSNCPGRTTRPAAAGAGSFHAPRRASDSTLFFPASLGDLAAACARKLFPKTGAEREREGLRRAGDLWVRRGKTHATTTDC